MTAMTTTKPTYMSCPRNCGVDVRHHNSSSLVGGRCDVTLLADPAQVALARELIQYARRNSATHAVYSIGDGTGRAYGPREHTWDLGHDRVLIHDGHLIYRRRDVNLLHAKDVTSVQQVADLLAAVGVLPFAFASAYRVGRSDSEWIRNVDTPPADRKCQYCGATSGLKPVFSGLGYAQRDYRCWDDCKDSAR